MPGGVLEAGGPGTRVVAALTKSLVRPRCVLFARYAGQSREVRRADAWLGEADEARCTQGKLACMHQSTNGPGEGSALRPTFIMLDVRPCAVQ